MPALSASRTQYHHIFPQSFRKDFEEIGIPIDMYTVVMNITDHLAGIHGNGGFVGCNNTYYPHEKYNDFWEDFFYKISISGMNPDMKDIFQFVGALMDYYEIQGEFKAWPYRKK